MTLARVFVVVAYLILGVSFVASTGLLIQEFQGTDWRSMIIAHSHIYLFFPVFGILALAAFYLPSVVFMDLYWRHLPYGKLRFLAGLVALAAISYGVAWWLDAKPRAVWEVSPRALAADKGDPAGCGAGAGSAPCRRAPILATLASLRKAGQTRVGLSKFARSCEIDPMLINASQTIRPGRGWWRTLIDMYGAADILVAEVQLQRLYPGGPARARFIGIHESSAL